MNRLEVPKLPAWPVVAAILINLIPVAGVMFWGWSVFALIFLYWLENIVIGVRTVGGMLLSGLSRSGLNSGGGPAGPLVYSAFFTVHYGMFCYVHGTFVVLFFGGPEMQGDTLRDLFDVARTLIADQTNLLYGFVGIVLWQVVIFVLFVARGHWRAKSAIELMFEPYPRIIVLHFTIIFGGMVLSLLHQPVAGLVVMALVKMAFDVAEATGKPLPFGRAAPGVRRAG